jgi:5-methylcytosine-specific restriction protein A
LRAAYIAAHPLCEHCLARGAVTQAQDVDHIIPHQNLDHLRLNWSNLQALCRACHAAKHAASNRRRESEEPGAGSS